MVQTLEIALFEKMIIYGGTRTAASENIVPSSGQSVLVVPQRALVLFCLTRTWTVVPSALLCSSKVTSMPVKLSGTMQLLLNKIWSKLLLSQQFMRQPRPFKRDTYVLHSSHTWHFDKLVYWLYNRAVCEKHWTWFGRSELIFLWSF